MADQSLKKVMDHFIEKQSNSMLKISYNPAFNNVNDIKQFKLTQSASKVAESTIKAAESPSKSRLYLKSITPNVHTKLGSKKNTSLIVMKESKKNITSASAAILDY